MKTLIRNVVSTTSVLAICLLPVTASGDSLADKRSNTPVETWGNQDVELERAILTETIDPTAAGSTAYNASGSQQGSMKQGEMSTRHGAASHNSAHENKRVIFGPN